MKTYKIEQGFTLIEVIIAVAIVAILAAVAYPSYLDSITKGRRAEGRTALLELLQQQERYITQRNCYLAFSTGTNGASSAAPAPSPPARPSNCDGLPFPAPFPFKNFSGRDLANSAYIISADYCISPGATQTTALTDCVRLVATPQGAHVKDTEAGRLRITTTGLKDCDGTKAAVPGVCWQ